MKETHSDKGLKTLELLGTRPSEWMLTPIKWVKEKREVLTEVCCPTCEGNKRVLFDEQRNVKPKPARMANPAYSKEYEGDDWDSARYTEARAAYRAAEEARNAYETEADAAFPKWSGLGNCPQCITKRTGYKTGRAMVLVLREVMIGYPQWPKGVQFDSRFCNDSSCQLCNKLIKKGGFVPVCTVPNHPYPKGMWVGEDCARKFLSVKVSHKVDHYIDQP